MQSKLLEKKLADFGVSGEVAEGAETRLRMALESDNDLHVAAEVTVTR